MEVCEYQLLLTQLATESWAPILEGSSLTLTTCNLYWTLGTVQFSLLVTGVPYLIPANWVPTTGDYILAWSVSPSCNCWLTASLQ